MTCLAASLRAWGSPAFEATLKDELEGLATSALPLQAAVAYGSCVADGPIKVMIMQIDASGPRLSIKVGVAFHSIIAGCNCADDPTPVNELAEFCELLLDIDKMTADTSVTLLD